MTQTGEEESQHLQVGEEGEVVAVLVQHVAEVGHRESVVPVVVGWVSVASLHHQDEPGRRVLHKIFHCL